jgi:hypothetical protein
MGEYVDASGTVFVKYFYGDVSCGDICYTSSLVDTAYILVGGFAYTEGTTGQGSYLTGSWPGFASDYSDPNRWYASSKDHLNPDPHCLHVVAIGLRLTGMSAKTLRNYVKIWAWTSGINHLPYEIPQLIWVIL